MSIEITKPMFMPAKPGRCPTWADATAHLTEAQRNSWKTAMRTAGVGWSETDDPIAEPYAESDPYKK